MLRRLGDDIRSRSYAVEANRLAYMSDKITSRIRHAVAKENKKAADAIRSVIQSRHTLIIRAVSRSASSELYTAKGAILEAAKSFGIEAVRFTV